MSNNTPDNLDFGDLSELDQLDKEVSDTPSAPSSTDTPTLQAKGASMSLLQSIPVAMTIEVASKQIPIRDLMEYSQGEVIVLDKVIGEPVDVKVNGMQFATGQIVETNGTYGVRLLNLADMDI